MGRIHDALRKAAEERDRKRRRQALEGPASVADVASDARSAAALPTAFTSEQAPPRSTERSSATLVDRGLTSPGPGGRAAQALEKLQRETTAEREIKRKELVGTIDPRIITFHDPRDPQAEQFRTIRATLLSLEPAPRSIMVTSGSPDDGKSVAAVNLAVSLVEGGQRRALLIDANLRDPYLHEVLGVKQGPGLSDVLAAKTDSLNDLVQRTVVRGVDVMGAGDSLDNPGGLLVPRAFSGVLGLLEDQYDFVIIDGAALDQFADAAVMAPEVDGVILVVRVGGPSRTSAERAVEILDQARARLIGAIATNCPEH